MILCETSQTCSSVRLVLWVSWLLLVADEWRGVDLLHQRVIVAANSPTHSVLSLWTAVVETFLDHKVHRRSSMEIFGQVLEVIQYVRVLERGTDMEGSHFRGPLIYISSAKGYLNQVRGWLTLNKCSLLSVTHANTFIFRELIHASMLFWPVTERSTFGE